MNRLAELMKELDYEDLALIKKDLEVGNIKKVLDLQLERAKATRISLCPVCNNPIREGDGFYLEFGNAGFRKKATFDGKDCIQYFLEHHLKQK